MWLSAYLTLRKMKEKKVSFCFTMDDLLVATVELFMVFLVEANIFINYIVTIILLKISHYSQYTIKSITWGKRCSDIFTELINKFKYLANNKYILSTYKQRNHE